MLKPLTAFLATGTVLLILDVIWLTSMIGVYRQHLGELLYDGVRMGPAVAFYLLYVTGIVVLAVLPAVDSGAGWQKAAMTGALLGLFAYGTYDLTNQATLKVWPTFITVMDLAWGTFLTATTAAAGAAVTSYFFRTV